MRFRQLIHAAQEKKKKKKGRNSKCQDAPKYFGI